MNTVPTWYKKHLEVGNCQKNYSGSSNAMEREAAQIIWQRSIERHNMRYTVILSDGNAAIFSHLEKLEVYGKDVKLEKQECINHISKRVGTSLCNLVKEWVVARRAV